MPQTRQELERREQATLAPYAQLSANSRGRKFKEEPPLWRTEYQRDRDRVIHSKAFRRLEYKTQVFLNGSGDHLRTRLTHTMEVAAISRNIARALHLNEDLAETIALAHDLGHSPFGHKGEAVLDKLMKKHGGFEHNAQSLRVVEQLEQKYPDFAGLNLTWETREGLGKHQTSYDKPGKRTEFAHRSPSLEAQVANLSDEITYYSHDLDDGLEAGLLNEAKLRKDVKLWGEASRSVKRAHGDLPDETRHYFIIRCLIDGHVRDVVTSTEEAILDSKVRSADEVRAQAKPLVRYSARRRKLNLELRDYLYKNLYYNPIVHEPNVRAIRLLETMFKHFIKHPEDMGEGARKGIRKWGRHRAVCDYLAGMTDRYLVHEHDRLFGVSI